jgi:hypothetical protein
MSLVACPECQKQISGQAEICVGCGYKHQMSKADTALVNIASNLAKLWVVVVLILVLIAISLLLTWIPIAIKP